MKKNYLILWVVLGVAILVLAVVGIVILAVPVSVTCDKAYVGFFTKYFPSPILQQPKDDSIILSPDSASQKVLLFGSNLLTGTSAPLSVLIDGNSTITDVSLLNCTQFSVRAHKMASCTEVSVEVITAKPSESVLISKLSVKNYDSSSKQNCSSSVNIVIPKASYIYDLYPPYFCSGMPNTLSGSDFLWTKNENSQNDQKPTLVLNSVAQLSVTELDSCTNYSIPGFDFFKMCKSAKISAPTYSQTNNELIQLFELHSKYISFSLNWLRTFGADMTQNTPESLPPVCIRSEPSSDHNVITITSGNLLHYFSPPNNLSNPTVYVNGTLSTYSSDYDDSKCFAVGVGSQLVFKCPSMNYFIPKTMDPSSPSTTSFQVLAPGSNGKCVTNYEAVTIPSTKFGKVSPEMFCYESQKGNDQLIEIDGSFSMENDQADLYVQSDGGNYKWLLDPNFTDCSITTISKHRIKTCNKLSFYYPDDYPSGEIPITMDSICKTSKASFLAISHPIIGWISPKQICKSKLPLKITIGGNYIMEPQSNYDPGSTNSSKPILSFGEKLLQIDSTGVCFIYYGWRWCGEATATIPNDFLDVGIYNVTISNKFDKNFMCDGLPNYKATFEVQKC